MKLINLKLHEQFRSLQEGFEVHFHNPKPELTFFENLAEFHPFCLTGLNGSGKSNILEVLANIFYHLECCVFNYPKYAFKPEESIPDIYELEYFIAKDSISNKFEDLVKVRITKNQAHAPRMQVIEYPFQFSWDKIDSFVITDEKGISYLPDLVVGYSSGENEILSLPFIKMRLFQYDEYLRGLIKDSIYEKPKSRLIYIDYEMSQAVLLTILLFFQNDKRIIDPLKDELGIHKINRFTINLNNYWQQIINEGSDEIEVETIFESINDKGRKTSKQILSHIQEQIEKLKRCATCYFENGTYTKIDFWVNESTIDAIKNTFKQGPYEFFSIFQILQVLNERVEKIQEKREIYNSKGFYTDYKKTEYKWFFFFTEYYIEKTNKGEAESYQLLLKNLSDGEQQFLHTIGICLMLQNRRTLLLLDEPETHFNPDWRSKFINILRNTLIAGNDNFLIKEVILTSHSPFIISDCLPDKIILLRKKDDKIEAISAQDLNFKTFGASVDYILQTFFGVKNLISEYSLEKLRELIKNGTEDELRYAIEFFGESSLKQFLYSALYKKTKKSENAD